MGILDIFSKKNKDTIVIKIEENLPIGTLVNLWLNPVTNHIHIYKYGFLSNDGLIGQHENKHLAIHLKNGKAFEANVIENKKISIKLFEKTEDEMQNENYLKNEYPNLLIELSKPIKVNEIKARLYISNGIQIEKDSIVFPVFFPKIEDHIKNRYLKLEFKNAQNQIVGIKKNEPSKLKQILRMHFANHIELTGKIQNVTSTDNNKEAEIILLPLRG